MSKTNERAATAQHVHSHTPGQSDTAEQEAQKLQALAAQEAGDYAPAETILAKLTTDHLAAAKAQQQAAHAQLRKAAETTAVRADLAMARIDYLAAAEHFGAAAHIVEHVDHEAATYYLARRAGALYMQGLEKGDNAALEAAVAARRELLHRVPRERVPLQWAMTQPAAAQADAESAETKE